MIRNHLVSYTFEHCHSYMEAHAFGGRLKEVLEDGNWTREQIDVCGAQELKDDVPAWAIASLIMNLFPAELAELANQIHRYQLKKTGQIGGSPYEACGACLEVVYAVGHTKENCPAFATPIPQINPIDPFCPEASPPTRLMS